MKHEGFRGSGRVNVYVGVSTRNLKERMRSSKEGIICVRNHMSKEVKEVTEPH